MDIAAARDLWQPDPGWLNTASYGLPPRPGWEALQRALDDWRAGRVSGRVWEGEAERARAAFAQLVRLTPDDVAIGANVSALVGLVAASLPAGSTVVVPDIEFTSNLFPWLVQADRGVEVEVVPVGELAASIDERTSAVAFSLVQSATGEIMPVDEIVPAARRVGALICVDATQACGWLPFDAGQFDTVAVAAYKWLMCPRGTAFLAVRPEVRDRILPLNAGWFAADDPSSSFYGTPMALADSARRFDVSPAWFSWVAAVPTLDLLDEIGLEAVHDHDVGLARRFCRGLGLPEGDSAIVSTDLPDAAERLAAAGIRVASRNGRTRLSFHVYSTTDEVDRAIEVLSAG